MLKNIATMLTISKKRKTNDSEHYPHIEKDMIEKMIVHTEYT